MSLSRVFLSIFLLFAATLGASAAPVNLVTNGSFTDGTVGFSTDYTFQPDTASADDMWNPGLYTIDDSASGRHSLWTNTGDHTTGTGNFMLVNGRTDVTSTVWRQAIAVAQNTWYFFEAWSLDLCCNDSIPNTAYVPSELSYWINGFLVGTASSVTGVWQGVSSMWNSASASLAVLEIRDASTAYSGNDNGIDDIYFGTESSMDPVPEPASMLLLGTGLSWAGYQARKRGWGRRKEQKAAA